MATNKNRNKGYNAERKIAQFFRELGFSFCKTSREASKLLDNAGIDLWGIPFNVQIKAGYSFFNETSIIVYMEDKIVELFPPNEPQHTNANIIINITDVGKGNKRGPNQTHVYMLEEEFNNIFKDNDAKDIISRSGQKRGWCVSQLLSDNKYIRYNRSKYYTFIIFTLDTLGELITLNKKQWQS